MNPGNDDGDASDATEASENKAFDAWRTLQKATDTKRADILADIVGHPEGTPSVGVLDYMDPSLSDDAIRRHPKELIDRRG